MCGFVSVFVTNKFLFVIHVNLREILCFYAPSVALLDSNPLLNLSVYFFCFKKFFNLKPCLVHMKCFC